jgi:hypothetical protein
MRSNSKKKGNLHSYTGGPVRKIQVPAFEFEKANQLEQYYQNELNTSQDEKAMRFKLTKKDEDKIPSLLKPDEVKKQSRIGSGRNNLLKPLEQDDKAKISSNLIDKQKYFDSNVRKA